ncbi:MAG: ABC transporter permease [candidate division CPR2 bacterium GW2011_GWD2_39_7]|nr:MAG: ABC transporter permease [candidate division CPR2 bacterium GW2011_GWD2_39_7]
MKKLLLADIKMLLRSKQTLFWSLMFPLMFTFIFGSFFGKGNNSVGTVALINESNTELAKSFDKAARDSGIFTIKDDINVEEAKKLIGKDQLSGAIVIPKGFGEQKPDAPKNIKVVYDPAGQAGRTLIGFTNQFLTAANLEIQQAKPIFSVEEEKTNTKQFGYFDFILMGLIGMALMNSSIQGMSIAMSKYREDKILKRLTTTPLKVWHFIAAEVTSRLLVNVIQVTLILLVGFYMFDAHINGSIFLIYVLALLGALLFQSIGFVIAGLSKTTNAAEGMSTAIAIPMMFLSGVFFPIDQLPKWLYSIVQYLPLAPLLRTMRSVALEDASPFANPSNLILVIVWVVAAFFA